MNKHENREKRRAGILMPVASLPSMDGVGGFGKSAYEFVDRLVEMNISIWQILPLNPLGYGNSPYQPYSSYGGDELYIDLGLLELEGYLNKGRSKYKSIPEKKDSIMYPEARAYKEKYFRQASTKFWQSDRRPEDFDGFIEQDWVENYAVFMAFKKKNNLKCWNEWPKEEQEWILDQKYDISLMANEIYYQIFLQYMFYHQWKQLKEYANNKGVLIMGDVPFYVGTDSVDVWQDRKDFLLDTDGRPIFIAGVPPDYFSKTGQRWGNPIYDWENMKKNDFHFWTNRLKYSNSLYDIIRIDHFRAFDTFWKIPVSCETAIDGEWIEAPGYQVLGQIFQELPDLWLVAEDLGNLRDEVLTLRDHFNLAGMNIAEFSALETSGAVCKHQLIYTGTHDNETVVEWYQNLDATKKKKARRRFCIDKDAEKAIAHRMISYICKSESEMAIISMADLLSLGHTARLNTPGTVGSPNWEWKMENFQSLDQCQSWLRKLIHKTGRNIANQ